MPPEIVPALVTTGYDACTTASNHTYDQGGAGIDRTLAALDAGGLAHAGSARTPEEAARLTIVDAGPARVALLSYTYGFNGIPAPDGQVWRSNLIDEGRILADATRARDAGADVVVVALHWGTEYNHDPDAQQAALAPRLIASPDVDLLLGHHAHVVQPLENVGGEWVVYGMGNLVARHSTQGDANHEGLLVRFTFTEGRGSWTVTNGGVRAAADDHRPRPDAGARRRRHPGLRLGAGADRPPGHRPRPHGRDRRLAGRRRRRRPPRRRLSGRGAQPPIVPGWPTW